MEAERDKVAYPQLHSSRAGILTTYSYSRRKQCLERGVTQRFETRAGNRGKHC